MTNYQWKWFNFKFLLFWMIWLNFICLGRSPWFVSQEDWWRYRQGYRRLEGTESYRWAQDPEQTGYGKKCYTLYVIYLKVFCAFIILSKQWFTKTWPFLLCAQDPCLAHLFNIYWFVNKNEISRYSFLRLFFANIYTFQL